MPTTRRVLLGAAAALAAPAALRAQPRFPDRPITVLVPFPPGGATDVQMRAFAEAATRAFGQTVIVENKPGAGSTLGASTVARSAPDGTVLAQMTLPCLRLPWMQSMPFDPRTDFTPIIHLTGYLFGVVVRADGPYRTWQDLVDDARKRPGLVKIGNTGANGTPHLTMVDLAEREKLDVIHVPFRGEGEAIPQLLGGHIDAQAAGSGSGQLVNEGKLRFLNLWSRTRSEHWPDVPTLVELAYPDMVVTSPYGLCGPAGMNHALVKALHDGLKLALFDPQHLATLKRLDQPVEYLDSAAYGRFMLQEIEQEKTRVERLGLKTG